MVAKSFIPDEHSGPPEALLVLVPVGVVQTEGLVNGGALVHELDGAAGVGGDVADGEQPMGEGRSTCGEDSRYPSLFNPYNQGLANSLSLAIFWLLYR